MLNKIAVSVTVALLAGNAVSQMSFGALGKTPEDPAWAYILTLYITLAIAGATSAISTRRIATILSAASSAALLGFFYGGTATNNNPQVAIAAAAIASILGALTAWKAKGGWFYVAIATAGAVAAYGFAFSAAMMASQFLSVQKLIWGVLWVSISLFYIGLTLRAIGFGVLKK